MPVPAWSDFLVQTFSYASVSLMTGEGRSGDATLPYWMAKLLSVLEGVQDEMVLPGRAWIDEAYVPEVAGKLWRRPDGKLPRGISGNQLCIGVGVDGSGGSVCIYEGKALMGVPDELNPMDPVIRVCFLPKALPRSHSGFDRDDLRGYLDLLHVIRSLILSGFEAFP